MIIILISLIRSWFFKLSQQILIIGLIIFCIIIYLPHFRFYSLWIFQDFIRIILIFLRLYLLVFIILIGTNSKLLKGLIFLLTFDLVLIFSTNNILVFYILFEFSLIPISLIILGWGFQPERLSATLYILFYTISTSFPFLAIIFYLDFPTFSELTTLRFNSFSIFSFIILLPFLVKLPMFITHLWLPKAHVEAPSYGSIILAGVLLKLGGYGIWRLYPILTNSSLILGIFSLTGAALCRVFVNIQTDVKAIIAYSRVVHIGLIAFCLILGSSLAILASLIIIIAHGICRSGLFCLISLSYQRITTRRVVISQGILSYLPSICLFVSLLLLINLRAPPSLNLLSEVNIIYSALSWQYISIIWIRLLILFRLTYRLVLFYSYFHGPISKYFATSSESKKEIGLSFFHSIWWILRPLIIWIFEF